MTNAQAEKFISNLHINGMDGRLLRMPAPNKTKKRHIMLLYGHHASLERMFGIAEVLNEHGTVMMPDLPGFGGMDSFYKIGEKPTLDNYADYLASLIKLQYKRRRVTIVAMSFSVPLVIKTLQKYPELARRVELFVSISGFAHRDDFMFSKWEYWGLRSLSAVFSRRLGAALMAHVVLTAPVLRLTYSSVSKSHTKMKTAESPVELKRRIDFEVNLWKINDVRTRFSTMGMMLTLDVCSQKINVPACHVTATTDRYFDHRIVEQHMLIIFNKLELIPSDMANHAPTIIAKAKEARPYIPKRLRKLLS
ncbi:MAG: hypothetical protein ACR2FM_05360 [Candidatus Saccharimonadales bacterium]